jgi:hypothetical protein
MSWRYRFYPLRDFEGAGVLASSDGDHQPAVFLTPAQAKAEATKRPRPSPS